MLVELSIRDLALIEEAELAFGPGLNAITGETGAGKSLLVGALELLLGIRPKGGTAAWVRSGAERARVEGRFELEPGPLAERAGAILAGVLDDDEPDDEPGGDGEPGAPRELILSRTAGADGRTRARVNGRPVTRRALRELAALLVEIHGQNDHQALLRPAEQLRLLDAFGGLDGARSDYAAAREVWLDLLRRVERLEAERAARRDRLELARFQLDELEALGLEPGEREALREQREVLRHGAELRTQLGGLVDELVEAEDGSLLDRLRAADALVGRWREHLPELDQPSEELRGAVVNLEEAAGALRTFVEGIELDPARLDEVEERLAEIERLERKHGVPRDSIGSSGDRLAERAVELAREIEVLRRDEEQLEGSSEELERARAAMASAAAALTKARRALVPKLSKAVVAGLASLGLERAAFEVRVGPRGTGLVSESDEAPPATGDHADDLRRFGPSGTDEVEFLLAANPGEPRRPLKDVASGGEAARIMLALRGVLAGGDRGRTLIFDEIDAGVGGRLGPAVGRSLAALGEHHQVLCVTHLPAIAATARTHLRVAKAVRRGRTRTLVEELTAEARVAEVADMIAGGGEQETARAEARRLLDGV